MRIQHVLANERYHVVSQMKLYKSNIQCYCRAGIELVLNSKVQSVRRNYVSVANSDGTVREIAFGACVWATGVAMHPLVKQLKVGP
jgi:NADH dehydrogenase FAD-containing subunit